MGGGGRDEMEEEEVEEEEERKKVEERSIEIFVFVLLLSDGYVCMSIPGEGCSF